MDVERLIGSASVRVATLAALLISVMGLMFRDYVSIPGGKSALFYLAVGSGVLAFIGLIHSFRALYSWWLRGAELLQKLVVTSLFGACYLLIVPWFFLIVRAVDLLRWRSRPETTFWIPRRRVKTDETSLARMG
jgi:hypothetical protein